MLPRSFLEFPDLLTEVICISFHRFVRYPVGVILDSMFVTGTRSSIVPSNLLHMRVSCWGGGHMFVAASNPKRQRFALEVRWRLR